MSGLTLAVWVALPYVAMTVFVVGHVWRWRHDQFGWTSRSSQLEESVLLKWGSPIFHYGTLAAIAGHVLGILIPASWTAALGIHEDLYHWISAIPGSLAAAAVVVGLIILLYRRITVPRVAAATSRTDILVYVLLTLIIALGAIETIGVNLLGSGYDYRASVSIWFRGLFLLDPQPGLMTAAPLLYQLHVFSAWFLFALWPFSRLVHAWSLPWAYVGRPWILFRSHRAARRAQGARRSV